jgi:hypothetical protein
VPLKFGRAYVASAAILVAAAAGTAGHALLRGDGAGDTHQVTVLAAWDTYVSEAKPDESYGSARQLRADGEPLAVRSYLHFEVPALRGKVRLAELRLHANAPDPVGILVTSVHSAGWTEAITWRSAPTVGEPVARGRDVGAKAWVYIDVRAVVRGAGPVDLALVGAGGTMVNYSSRDDGEGTAPRLVISTWV